MSEDYETADFPEAAVKQILQHLDPRPPRCLAAIQRTRRRRRWKRVRARLAQRRGRGALDHIMVPSIPAYARRDVTIAGWDRTAARFTMLQEAA